ncbi:MAG: tetratricopeptide repeat protein [Verrucomicrobia bacterium]|nr:tetratricopeptide repeat protein [Verrucomicrobiota bacterium]
MLFGLALCTALALPVARGQENNAPSSNGPPSRRAASIAAPDDTNADPSELFLKAFSAVQQAESLEKEGKLRAALAKYRFAASLLEQISQNNPNWQPLIVAYRARKTADALSKLQQKVALQEQTSAGPSATPPAGGSNRETAPPPSVSAEPEEDDPLPRADGPGAPARTTARNGSTMTTTDNGGATVGRAAQEMRARMEKLQAELRDARKQLEAAQKERKKLLDQVESTQGDSQEAAKLAERTKAERDNLQAQLDQAQARLKEATTKNPDAIETRKELRQQVAKLHESLDKANEANEKATREKERLAARLAASERRNSVHIRGPVSQTANERIESLAAENDALMQKLTEAERTISDLNTEANKKKEEAEAVQVELTKLRQQLVASQDQNDRASTQITELKKQLDDAADRIAQGVPRDEVNKITKENDLLKNIALRLLKEQARRTQASKLVSDELARLEVQSKSLTEQLDLLGQPTVQLTDEERALFREPQVNVSDNANPNTLAVSIVSVAQPGASPSPTTPGEQASPPSSDNNAAASSSPAPASSLANAAASPGSENGNGGPTVQTDSKPPVPPELVSLAREAKSLLVSGRYAEAEEAYQKLVARAPKNVYALSNLAVALSRQGKLKSAETQLKKAIALAPKDAFSYVTLGSIYYQMRKFDDALDCLTKACALDPKNASAHNYLGITSSQKGWPEAAIEELEKAIALNPNYADAHFNLAVVYALNQPPIKDKAQLHYRQATALGASPDPALERLIN